MKCPKCGEELPLLSKICPVCKTVVDKEDGAPNALDLAQALDSIIIKIKKLVPEASQIKLTGFIWLYILIACVFLGMLAVKTGAGILWIFTLLGVIAAILVYQRTRLVTVASKLAESKIAYEHGITLVKRYFKGDTEMSRFLDDNATIVKQAEEGITNGRRRTMLFGVGIALAEAILCAIIIIAVPSREAKAKQKAEAALQMPNDYDGQVTWFIKNQQPEKAIEAYAASEFNEEYTGASKRTALCETLCQAGFTAKAEDFVLRYCIGKMQDFECAKIVILSYLAGGDKEAATSFLAKCSGLKYKSDIAKLKELI